MPVGRHPLNRVRQVSRRRILMSQTDTRMAEMTRQRSLTLADPRIVNVAVCSCRSLDLPGDQSGRADDFDQHL
jgi:hypothetical protein